MGLLKRHLNLLPWYLLIRSLNAKAKPWKEQGIFFFISEVHLIDKAKMREKLFLAWSEPLISKSPSEQGLSVTEAVLIYKSPHQEQTGLTTSGSQPKKMQKQPQPFHLEQLNGVLKCMAQITLIYRNLLKYPKVLYFDSKPHHHEVALTCL